MGMRQKHPWIPLFMNFHRDPCGVHLGKTSGSVWGGDLAEPPMSLAGLSRSAVGDGADMGVSMAMGTPIARWMVFVNGKIPSRNG